LSDLWTAYLMLLESDGRNESQLIEWSDIRRFLYHVIMYRARTPRGPSSLWFSDTEGTALTIWLLWMTASAGESRLRGCSDIIFTSGIIRDYKGGASATSSGNSGVASSFRCRRLSSMCSFSCPLHVSWLMSFFYSIFLVSVVSNARFSFRVAAMSVARGCRSPHIGPSTQNHNAYAL
jgi:hypothetical protein